MAFGFMRKITQRFTQGKSLGQEGGSLSHRGDPARVTSPGAMGTDREGIPVAPASNQPTAHTGPAPMGTEQ